MHLPLHITLLFIGVFALIQVPLTVFVGYRRAKTGVQFFDGGDPILLRRMRAHGNYIETVPTVPGITLLRVVAVLPLVVGLCLAYVIHSKPRTA